MGAALNTKELERLSGRLNIKQEDIDQAGLSDNELRDIYDRTRNNYLNLIKLYLVIAYLAYAAIAGGDRLQYLADVPVIEESIASAKTSPATRPVGELYENILTSPQTPHVLRGIIGLEFILLSGLLFRNRRRREAIGREITGHNAGGKNTLTATR